MKEIDSVGIKVLKGKEGTGVVVLLYSEREIIEFHLSRKVARDLMRAIYRGIGTRTYGPPDIP